MLEMTVAVFNIAGMIATVGTLAFGVFTYRKNTIDANSRRVRETLLEIERIVVSYRDAITESLFAPMSYSIAMLVCEDAIRNNDVSLARRILNSENNRVKNRILVGMDRAGKYATLKKELAVLESKPLLIKEDLPVVSRLLQEAVNLLAKSSRAAISPALYDTMLLEANITQFLEHTEAIDDPKEFAEELAIYFDHGPMIFLEKAGRKTFRNTQEIIGQITRVWVDLDDKALYEQKAKQKELAKSMERTGTFTGDIRKCIGLIEEWIPRETHIAISEAIARLEENLGAGEEG